MRPGWELKKISDLYDVTSSKRVHKSDWTTYGIPFYRAREIVKLARNGKVDNDLFISEELYKEFISIKGAPKKGDLLVSGVGTIGKCYVVKDGDKLYFKDASVLWYRKLDETNSDYIEYAFKSDYIINQIMENSMGATVGTLTISRAKNTNIPVPSFDMQKQIVAILDEAFQAIDIVKENTEKNLANSKELFQSRLNEIFSQKGEGWKEKKLEELSKHKKAIVSGPFGSNLKVSDYRDSGVPIIRLQNIGKGHFIEKNIKYIEESKAEELKSHSFEIGDIVLAKLGIPIGKTCIIPNNFTDGIILADIVRIRPDKNVVNYQFLEYFLNTSLSVSQLTKNISGATRPRVNLSNVRSIVAPIPPLEEQNKIVLEINHLENNTKKLEKHYQQRLNSLEELKKSIFQKAFNGELVK